MRLGLAFRVWWRILQDAKFALSVEGIMRQSPEEAVQGEPTREPARPKQSKAKEKPARSDAITLLASLQREARFVDMVQEPLAEYSDAQVGAAVRDVLRDCHQVLDRFFGLEPAVEQQEGSSINVAEGYDAGFFRLVGVVQGPPPFAGRVVHHGWKATRCEIPRWTGHVSSRWVLAPVEVEITSSGSESGSER